MSELMRKDKDYAAWVKELKERYRHGQIKAAIAVNTGMLAFYWSVGRGIVRRDAENAYGSGFFESLSADLC